MTEAPPNLRIVNEIPVSAIQSLEDYFSQGGASIIQAAFAHTYFAHPDKVREKTPYFPNRARTSREHYPGFSQGSYATWHGDRRKVRLGYNQRAQMAWQKYTGHKIARRSGYGVRHIWGHPWDPEAFTAGWNFCYMPFWAGMLTEKQHPHPALEKAIRQASWDLYFRDNAVCRPPDFVENPGVDLEAVLDGNPVLVLEAPSRPTRPRPNRPISDTNESVLERVKGIRRATNQSWVNIRKASRLLQEKPFKPFGTRNVENTAKSVVRRICRESGLSFEEIETLLDENGWGRNAQTEEADHVRC